MDYYLRLGKSFPDGKKNCDLISRTALEALYVMAPGSHYSSKLQKGLRETGGFLGLKGSRTERRNLQRPSMRAAGTCDHIHIKVRLEKIMLFSFQLDGQGYIGSQTLAPEVELDK